MPKPEWGVKRTCTHCRARFYDLQRSPVVCPKCGTELDLSEAVKLKRGAPAAARAVPAAPKAEAEEALVYDEAETEEETEEAEVEEEAPLAIEDEEEEEDEVPVAKKGKSEEDSELETFDEDVLLEEDEEDEEELGDLDDLDDDDLKGV